jgi:DDE superfamily endonuclease
MKWVARLSRRPTPHGPKVELWCEDEHRLGLKPILGKAWSPIGQRPLVMKGHQRYEWTYTSTLWRARRAEKCTGSSYPHGQRGGRLLGGFGALRQGSSGSGHKRKRVLLVLDRAGWHTAKKELKVPEGIHLEFLPSHSPELQPSERPWPLSDEAVAKRHFEEIEELEETIAARWVAVGDQPEVIRSYIR